MLLSKPVCSQGNSVRVMWSIDDDGNMTPVNSVLLAKVVTLQVEVPQGTHFTCFTSTKVQNADS